MMITTLVTYAGDEQTPFDREHWINAFPARAGSWAHRRRFGLTIARQPVSDPARSSHLNNRR